MGGKWVGFLKQIAPYVTRIALMSNPATSPQARGYLPSIETTARSLGLHPIATPVHDAAEVERAIAALGRRARHGRNQSVRKTIAISAGSAHNHARETRNISTA